MIDRGRSSSYIIVNIILAVILLLILIYSGLFSIEKINHPIHSAYSHITGDDTVSTGLSRAFSALIRGKFRQADIYNSHAKGIFLFFLSQLVFRIAFSFIVQKKPAWKKRIIRFDILQAVVLFLTAFFPFILYLKDSIL